MKKESPNYPIKVLDKSLTLIELLLKHESSMNITEISKILGFYPSTTHRILDTFKHWGYVEQDVHTQKYQLGLKALELGMVKLNRMDIVNEAIPYLKELVYYLRGMAFYEYANELDYANDKVADIDALIDSGTMSHARADRALELYAKSLADFQKVSPGNHPKVVRSVQQHTDKINKLQERLTKIKQQIYHKEKTR